MDFTEAAEYKFLCPSLLIGFHGQKGETKVEGWGRREPKILGREIRRVDGRQHRKKKYPHQHTTSRQSTSSNGLNTTTTFHDGSGFNTASSPSGSIEHEILNSRYCPNQIDHHSSIDKCWQERCKSSSLGRPTQQQGEHAFIGAAASSSNTGMSTSDPIDIPTDRIALSQHAKETRGLLYDVQEMLVSSPKFEPTFHLEDIDLAHGDTMTFDEFILNAAINHLHESRRPYTTTRPEHPKKSQDTKQLTSQRLKGVMSVGNLTRLAAQFPRDGSGGQMSKQNVQYGGLVAQRRPDTRQNINPVTPANPTPGATATTTTTINNNNRNGLIADVPAIQFNQQTAKMCGVDIPTKSSIGTSLSPLLRSSNLHHMVFNDDPFAVIEHAAGDPQQNNGHSIFFHNNDRYTHTSTTPLRRRTTGLAPTSTYHSPRHSQFHPSPPSFPRQNRHLHSRRKKSSLTEGLARLHFITTNFGTDADAEHGALSDGSNSSEDSDFQYPLTAEDRIKLYHERRSEHQPVGSKTDDAVRAQEIQLYGDDGVVDSLSESDEALNIWDGGTSTRGRRGREVVSRDEIVPTSDMSTLRVLLPGKTTSWIKVPMTTDVTAFQAIQLIIKSLTGQQHQEIRGRPPSEYELRLLDDEEPDYDCPPIDLNAQLLGGGINDVALCPKSEGDPMLTNESEATKDDVDQSITSVHEEAKEFVNSDVLSFDEMEKMKNLHRQRSSTDRRLSLAERSTMSQMSDAGSTSHQRWEGVGQQQRHDHHQGDDDQHDGRCSSQRRSSLPWDPDIYVSDNTAIKTHSNSTTGPNTHTQHTTTVHTINQQSVSDNDSNIVGSLAMSENGKIAGVAIGKHGVPFEVSQDPLSDFSPEENHPSQLTNRIPQVSHPALPPLPAFVSQLFTMLRPPGSARASPIGSARRRYSATNSFGHNSTSCATPATEASGQSSPRPNQSRRQSDTVPQPSKLGDISDSPKRASLDSTSRSAPSSAQPSLTIPTTTADQLTSIHGSSTSEAPLDGLARPTLYDGVTVNRWDFSRDISPTRKLPSHVRNVTPSPKVRDTSIQRRCLTPVSRRSNSISRTPRQRTSSATEVQTNECPLPSTSQESNVSQSIPIGSMDAPHSSNTRGKALDPQQQEQSRSLKKFPGVVLSIGSNASAVLGQSDDGLVTASGQRTSRRRSSAARDAREVAQQQQRPPLSICRRKDTASFECRSRHSGNTSPKPRFNHQLSDQLTTTSNRLYKASGILMNRFDPRCLQSQSSGMINRLRNGIGIPTRLFVILSIRAASEINPMIDIESRDVVRVSSQLISLGQDRRDIELLRVPEDSRVFELLSYLSKTQKNTEILGPDSPNPGMLFFESFFNGHRIETDVLVHTLNKFDSCLVLMRKKTRATENKRQYASSRPSSAASGFDHNDFRNGRESVASRPPLELFEFNEYRTNQPMTYRCSVAVIDVGGSPVPLERRRFHTCQVVVDGRRLYHSFLQGTPWDDDDSSNSDDDNGHPDCSAETEKLDHNYTKAKNERIRLFTNVSQITAVSGLCSPRSTSDKTSPKSSTNSLTNQRDPISKQSSVMSPTFASSSPSISSSPSSPCLVPGLNLADLFVPAHLSVADILAVQPHPTIASQLEVAYTIPRPLKDLGAVPEGEDESSMNGSPQTSKEGVVKSPDLAFQDVVNTYAFGPRLDSTDSTIPKISTLQSDENLLAGRSSFSSQQPLQRQNSRTSSTPTTTPSQSGMFSASISRRSVSDFGQQSRPSSRIAATVEVRVAYVAESPHTCAELSARLRFLAKL